MRNHENLLAFKLADELVTMIYEETVQFPREEQYGLTSQLRRAVVSIASNIVEGSARNSEADFIHFLYMAYGSAREVQYQVSLANRFGYLSAEKYKFLNSKCMETSKVLNGLIRSFRNQNDPECQ